MLSLRQASALGSLKVKGFPLHCSIKEKPYTRSFIPPLPSLVAIPSASSSVMNTSYIKQSASTHIAELQIIIMFTLWLALSPPSHPPPLLPATSATTPPHSPPYSKT